MCFVLKSIRIRYFWALSAQKLMDKNYAYLIFNQNAFALSETMICYVLQKIAYFQHSTLLSGRKVENSCLVCVNANISWSLCLLRFETCIVRRGFVFDCEVVNKIDVYRNGFSQFEKKNLLTYEIWHCLHT